MQRDPARHHALRRTERGAPDRRDGGGVSGRDGAAQSAGAGQHGGLARVRLCHAVATSSARRSLRRAVARRGRERRLRSTEGEIVRPSDRPGLGIEIDGTRSRSIRSSRNSCSGSSTPTEASETGRLYVRRDRRRARAAGVPLRAPHLARDQRGGLRRRRSRGAAGRRNRTARASPAARRRREARDVALPGRRRAVFRVDPQNAAGELRLLPPRDGLPLGRSTSSRPRS